MNDYRLWLNLSIIIFIHKLYSYLRLGKLLKFLLGTLCLINLLLGNILKLFLGNLLHTAAFGPSLGRNLRPRTYSLCTHTWGMNLLWNSLGNNLGLWPLPWKHTSTQKYCFSPLILPSYLPFQSDRGQKERFSHKGSKTRGSKVRFVHRLHGWG